MGGEPSQERQHLVGDVIEARLAEMPAIGTVENQQQRELPSLSRIAALHSLWQEWIQSARNVWHDGGLSVLMVLFLMYALISGPSFGIRSLYCRDSLENSTKCEVSFYIQTAFGFVEILAFGYYFLTIEFEKHIKRMGFSQLICIVCFFICLAVNVLGLKYEDKEKFSMQLFFDAANQMFLLIYWTFTNIDDAKSTASYYLVRGSQFLQILLTGLVVVCFMFVEKDAAIDDIDFLRPVIGGIFFIEILNIAVFATITMTHEPKANIERPNSFIIWGLAALYFSEYLTLLMRVSFCSPFVHGHSVPSESFEGPCAVGYSIQLVMNAGLFLGALFNYCRLSERRNPLPNFMNHLLLYLSIIALMGVVFVVLIADLYTISKSLPVSQYDVASHSFQPLINFFAYGYLLFAWEHLRRVKESFTPKLALFVLHCVFVMILLLKNVTDHHGNWNDFGVAVSENVLVFELSHFAWEVVFPHHHGEAHQLVVNDGLADHTETELYPIPAPNSQVEITIPNERLVVNPREEV